MSIKGFCHPGFSAIEACFDDNFSKRGELGAALSVFVDGELKANLWSGVADQDGGHFWEEDTICNVFSCSKGALALCAHMLVDSGELDFDSPISRYWPEFAQQGKSDIPVRMILNHQLGLPAVRNAISIAELYQPEVLPRMLAGEDLFWMPGTRHGYHALTFGALLDELFRRICGQGIGEFFRQEVAKPLGLDFWFGLPEEQERRVARLMASPAVQISAANDVATNSIVDHVRRGLEVFTANISSREFRAAGIPAGGGIGSALALAKMYTPLALDGSVSGKRLVSESAISRMAYPRSSSERDGILPIATCFTLGFAKSWSAGPVTEGLGYAIGEKAFGHPGMGGSIAFADPGHGLSFAYVTNRMNGLPSLDNRAQSLIDSVYTLLGLQDRDPGYWR